MRIWKLTLLLFAAVLPCLSQEARGTILGRVTDATGGVVPGISIQVINQATGIAVSLTSNEQGNYYAPTGLPPPARASGISFAAASSCAWTIVWKSISEWK